MKPIEVLARERSVDHGELVLARRDGVYTLMLDGALLMTSRAHGSERLLAQLACSGLAAPKPRVLIGGLGFGYTLRAALDVLPMGARVVVREISALVIDANRGAEVGALAGHPLADERVAVEHGDLGAAFGKRPYDAIVLDVDNGPHEFTLKKNARFYSPGGLETMARSLTPQGVLAVWSEAPDPSFTHKLERAGFEVELRTARQDARHRGARHAIYLARLGGRSPGLSSRA
jgi:spermidine synthase